jgi:2-polyprenyl-3-methyl-5-hydroxy-6-metoxy-1,4-benzoquinol methylase
MKSDIGEGRLVRQAIAARYAAHYRACSGATHKPSVSPGTWNAICRLYDWDVLPYLPAWRDRPVVELGTGYGYLVEYLLDRGFANVSAVDMCEELLAVVKQRLGPRLAGAHCCDAKTFLDGVNNHFGLVLMFDLIEHMSLDDAFEVLCAARRAIAPGGLIVLKTMNMAHLMGCYVRYNDLTHCHAYTSLTMRQMLEISGFTNVVLCNRNRRRTLKGQCAHLLNNVIHRLLALISHATPSETYQGWLTVRAQRPTN